jgi:transcriptional regulator with XRE-family HTH domain
MLGQELRRAREDANLTQEQLSFAAKIDRSYISQLENDRKSPTVDVLFRICDSLGVSASRLLAQVEATQKPKSRKR